MTEFFTVVVIHMFAVMSPGPDFFFNIQAKYPLW